MGKKHATTPPPSRRKFIAHSLLGTVSMALGFTFGKIIPRKKEDNKTVRLITADGKVVEVARKHLPINSEQKVASNVDLKEWMEEGQKRKNSK